MKGEENIKIGIEGELRKITKELGLPWGRYEKRVLIFDSPTKSSGKIDALYGHVVIEYEDLKAFETLANFKHAKQQVKDYIGGLAKETGEDKSKFFGVVLDGFKIGFVRWKSAKLAWLEDEDPKDINKDTVVSWLEALRGLGKISLTAQNLLDIFGPNKTISEKVIQSLYNKLGHATEPRTPVFFKDWKQLYSIACGFDLKVKKVKEGLEKLRAQYSITLASPDDYDTLLFAVHTYFAILMKILTAEITVTIRSMLVQSYLSQLMEAYHTGKSEFRNSLEELEQGGIFRQLNIDNFIEEDYFSWYLYEWDDDLAGGLIEVIRGLDHFEPSTPELEPDRVRDLFKEIYQKLVPKELRHSLGEFYTPDWLAEMVLVELSINTAFKKERIKEQIVLSMPRILDPACGSGTFLVLAIRMFQDWAAKNSVDKKALLRGILDSIVGFDLNPIAVMAARANFIIQLGELIRYDEGKITIPIYLSDSVFLEKRVELLGPVITYNSAVGPLTLPSTIKSYDEMTEILGYMRTCLEAKVESDAFEKGLGSKFPKIMDKTLLNFFRKLYESIFNIKFTKKEDSIWVNVLKNYCAPIYCGKFDFVIGNPPWINWESIPKKFRDDSINIWKEYSLFDSGPKKIGEPKKKGLGKKRKELAMLFVAKCFAVYCNPTGRLGMLIPYNIYKNPASGGFRTHLSSKCNVDKILDLVELKPFENAINRTSMIIISKGPSPPKTKFPIPCDSWAMVRGTSSVPFSWDLQEFKENIGKKVVSKQLSIYQMNATDPWGPWLFLDKGSAETVNVFEKLKGETPYYAEKTHAGVFAGSNGIYWVRIMKKMSPGTFLIENVTRDNGMGRDKRVPKVKMQCEGDLLFPILRGKDVAKWKFKFSDIYMVVPHDTTTGDPLPPGTLASKYPKALEFLNHFENDLKDEKGKALHLLSTREIQKLWGAKKPYYSLYDIADYAFTSVKVVWLEISGKISGKADFHCCVVNDANCEELGKKMIIPSHKLMMLCLDDVKEAFYVSGILNSSPVRYFVSCFTLEISIGTHIMSYIKIPRFDKKNKLHQDIASESVKAQSNTDKGEISSIESRIDQHIAELYGIKEKELKVVQGKMAALYPKKIKKGTAISDDVKAEKDGSLEVKKDAETVLIDTFDIKHLNFVNNLAQYDEGIEEFFKSIGIATNKDVLTLNEKDLTLAILKQKDQADLWKRVIERYYNNQIKALKEGIEALHGELDDRSNKEEEINAEEYEDFEDDELQEMVDNGKLSEEIFDELQELRESRDGDEIEGEISDLEEDIKDIESIVKTDLPTQLKTFLPAFLKEVIADANNKRFNLDIKPSKN